jgi:3-oxoacyl-[acyl-carrier-protein] synthase II
MRNRVCVTGMGVVCSGGNDCGSFGKVIAAGTPCFSRITHPKLGHLKSKYAGIISNFKEQPGSACIRLPPLDRFHYLALAAAGQALTNASLPASLRMSASTGVLVGTCSGPMLSIERSYEDKDRDPAKNTKEKFFARRYDSCAKVLAMVFGIPGMSATVVTACSAGLVAIGTAVDLIRVGAMERMLVGGSDTISPTTVAGFDGLKATAEAACAPFSLPFGLSLGEAAAFLVLENRECALQRGAAVLAEIAGFGLSNDAYHCTSPDPTGAGQALAMERALCDAGVSPDAVVYINAHGTGTEANDKTETKAIRRVFGGRAAAIPISSTKSMIGHCLGAAGCLETITTIIGHQLHVYPPTANFSAARQGCTLDYIPDAGRPWTVKGPVVNNNFAFGGNNASLVFYPGSVGEREFPDRSAAEPIVITACGIVSAAGVGKEDFVSAVHGGIALFRTMDFPGRESLEVAAVPSFDMNRIDRRIDARLMDKSSKFATAAARLALQDSAFFDKAGKRGNLGFFLNCATGTTQAESDYITSLLRDDYHVQQVSSFPYVVPNSITGNVCRALSLTGHNSTFCLGPGAGLMGLGFAWHALRNGHVSALLCGSVDELLEKELMEKTPGGLMPGNPPPGEGACVFMLETLTHARPRNAILGELCAIAYSTDLEFATHCDATTTNLQNTIKQALSEAGITPRHIGALCYRTANVREKEAIAAVMGSSDYRTIDVSNIIGFASATFPLNNIAFALFDSSFEPEESKNYFLAVFGSDIGINCAAVIRKNVCIKE